MDISRLYLILGATAAFLGGIFMIYAAIKHPYLWLMARWVYILVGLLDLYLMIVYALTIVRILSIPGYGDYVRPVLVPIVLAPAMIAWLNRRVR